MLRLPKTLPGWYQRLGNGLGQQITEVTRISQAGTAEVWPRAFLATSGIAGFVGGAPHHAIPLGSGDQFADFLSELWGRRCILFFRQAESGFRVALTLDREDAWLRVPLDEFHEVVESLDARFGLKPNIPSTGEINLSNYHVTYLDPVLFSALLFIHENEHRLDKIQRAGLLATIESEIAQYVEPGEGALRLKAELKDESTLWWGATRLYKETDHPFQVHHLSGREGLLALVQMLAKREKPQFPDARAACLEATYEIHGEARTRLMIVNNALYFLERRAVTKQLKADLESLIEWHIRWIHARPSGVDQHFYLSGLSLESCGLVMRHERGRSEDATGKTAKPDRRGYRFDVALSFPGEHRSIVSAVANALAAQIGSEKVLYDKFHQAEFARPNLDTHLQMLYADRSLLIVVFLCGEYRQKDWCGLEWRAVRQLIKERHDDRVMFVRLDDTDVPGVFGIDGFIDGRHSSTQNLVNMIMQRLTALR